MEEKIDRRVKKNPRKRVYQIRLNNEEAELFDAISYETEDTRAEVFRKALKMYAHVKRSNMGDSFLG